MFVVIRDVAAVVGAVGDVTVDEEIGLPKVPELKPGTRFGSVGFHVVTIKVLVRAGRAPTHVRGAVLIDAIVGTRSLVTIGVVDRDKEQYDVVQNSGDSLRDGDVAK